jgi:hypothetical protein
MGRIPAIPRITAYVLGAAEHDIQEKQVTQTLTVQLAIGHGLCFNVVVLPVSSETLGCL